MKIAFLAPEFLPTWGGVGTYSVNLVRELAQKKDVHIYVITPQRGVDYDAKKIEAFFNTKKRKRVTIINISTANDGFFYNAIFQWAVFRNFEKLHKKYKFDLVHAANLVHMPDILIKHKKLGIPMVTTVHTTLASQSFHGIKKGASQVESLTKLTYPLIKTLESYYLKKSKNLISVSNWVKKFLPKQKRKITQTIHNGIDFARFSKKPTGMFSYLAKQNKPLVLFSGRLLQLKGIATLLRAVPLVLKKTNVLFVFAGSGSVKPWQRLIAKVPVGNIKFLGYVPYEDIHELYAVSEVFVLPSYTESFPLTLLEAMASSCAVIASKVGGIPEMIREGKQGMLVTPGNPHELANAISTLIKNNKKRSMLAASGKKQVKKNFTAKRMAEETYKYYQNMVNAQ